MPQQRAATVDNQFVGGLKTEFTGLNFPDNSFIDAENITVHRTGLITRRNGFDYEVNYSAIEDVDPSNSAINTYWWRNATGDGIASILVVQVGSNLYFYQTSDATANSPLSTTKLSASVTLSDYTAEGSSFDASIECQFTDGNGFLFVFHPNIDPIYCKYDPDDGSITPTVINIQIRDTVGIIETDIADNLRPSTLTDIHHYNLSNQGWSGKAWTTTSSSSVAYAVSEDPVNFTVDSDLPIKAGDLILITTTNDDDVVITMNAAVYSYGSTSLNVGITAIDTPAENGNVFTSWTLGPALDYVGTWFKEIGNYPSNSDVWWLFKDSTDVFNPSKEINNVSLSAGAAPKGFYILDAFNQDRSAASGIAELDIVTSNKIRPSTGIWFAGRIWYAGINAQTFSENLYFSQIIENITQAGYCYEVNDPTSEDRFDLLPSDGGYVSIQGVGTIHKLFPVANGLLVFSSKGVWFITGSTGIGFTASDFTITKISAVESLSPTSFVDVLGTPMWWNQEGIYVCAPSQQGFTVNSATNTTIASFYQNIPVLSKYYAHGYYNPVTFQIQWIYRDTAETDIANRYRFSSALVLDTQIQAFYPWSLNITDDTFIANLIVVGGIGIDETIPYNFKYLTFTDTDMTFSEERDTNYLDWVTPTTDGVDYSSNFITGYRVYGQGNTFTQLPYVDIHAADSTSYCDFQSRWDYATSGNTGKWSTVQRAVFDKPDRAYQTKRLRTRGRGRAVQLRFSSISGSPMSLIGWSTLVENTQVP